MMEQQYLNLLERTLEMGIRQSNRTGIDTFRIEGATLEFDLREGFPAITTKKLAFKQVVGELYGFIHGFTTAVEFREVGCTIWDQNANENKQWLTNPRRKGQDDLGEIYGFLWRYWPKGGGRSYNREHIDQLQLAVNKIVHTPEDRRIIVSAWNPGRLEHMALPPCHVMHQYICDPTSKELSLCMYQRSCDMFLGVPFNIASYALLLEMVALVTGYKPKKLIMFLADVHIYENHVEQVTEQLTRLPYKAPRVSITQEIPSLQEREEQRDNPFYSYDSSPFGRLMHIRPEHVKLLDYEHHPAISAPMAV